jgi:hypothetical protein
MWEPRRLTNLWASMAWYRDSFTFLVVVVVVVAVVVVVKEPGDSSPCLPSHHIDATLVQLLCESISQSVTLAVFLKGQYSHR